jgi:Na+-driven multidrug efflux pump
MTRRTRISIETWDRGLSAAEPAARLMAARGAVVGGATTYLRIAALGAPFFMAASAGQGFLRGMGNLRTPLVVLVAAHAANVVLELLFVYGFRWGLTGSAWGTVIAQAGMGGAFLAVQRRAGFDRPHPAAMRPLMRIGSEIAVRTSALTGSFLVASAVLARIGAASLGAHQVAFQLWVFLALILDAIAIAGQVMVGRMLGGGDAAGAREAALRMIAWSVSLGAHQIAFQLWVFLALVLDALAIAAQVMVGRALGASDAGRARAAALRVIGWSVAVGTLFGAVLGPLGGVVPALFTSDPTVQQRAAEIWWIFAATMPANGAVFALDGILIGAGDTRFLMWGMLAASAVYVPVALLALHEGWGIRGVWCGLAGLIAVRLATCVGRFLSGRWAALGAG